MFVVVVASGKGLVRDGRFHEDLADGCGIDEELRREVRVPH